MYKLYVKKLYGGAGLQSRVGAPTEIINIVIGVIVFFVALSYLIPRFVDRLDASRLNRKRAREAKKAQKAKKG